MKTRTSITAATLAIAIFATAANANTRAEIADTYSYVTTQTQQQFYGQFIGGVRVSAGDIDG